MTSEVIAISVGVGAALFVVLLIIIVVVFQKKLQKKDIDEAKEKIDKKYNFDEIEDGRYQREAKTKKNQRMAATQTPHSQSTQTSIANKCNVFYTRGSRASYSQHPPRLTIPRVINYLPLYAGEVTKAKPKPSQLSEEEKEAIITDLKKNYPTKPIPLLVISEPKEKERQDTYSRNWQMEKTYLNNPAGRSKSADGTNYAKARKKINTLGSGSAEEIIEFGEQTWQRRMEDVLKNLEEHIANQACKEGKAIIPRPVVHL